MVCRQFVPREISLGGRLWWDDGHEHVNGNRNPKFGFDCVFGSAIESFDAQVLLDPLEEELHLRTAFVKKCDRQCG